MQKKALTVFSLLLIFSLTFTFVGSFQKVEAAEGDYEVAYVARSLSDSFAAWLANSLQEEAKKYEDINLEMYDAQAGTQKQISLVETAIVKDFDLIIVQPRNSEALSPVLNEVVDAGIDLITTNPKVEGIEGASFVDADPYAQAGVVAIQARNQVPQNANVVVLYGPPGNLHAIVRKKAWQQIFFQNRPDVNIVGEQIANWNKSQAIDYMEDWVTRAEGKIDAIISMNDNMAAGAIEVLKDNENYDPEDVYAYGVDGTAEAVQLIEEGWLTATCFQNAYQLGKINMEVAHKLLTGEEEQIKTYIGTPLITQDNLEELRSVHEEAGNL